MPPLNVALWHMDYFAEGSQDPADSGKTLLSYLSKKKLKIGGLAQKKS